MRCLHGRSLSVVLFIVRTSLIGVQYIVEALQLQTWRKGGGIPVSDEEAIDFSGVQYVFDVNGFEKFIEVVDAENTISGCVGHSAYRLRVRKLWQCVTLS